jgi:uncharacterized protein (TIGR02099 family)
MSPLTPPQDSDPHDKPGCEPDSEHGRESGGVAGRVEAAQESAVQVVHAAEQFVERAVVAAELSLALRIGQGGLRVVLLGVRTLVTLAVIAYFLFCLTVLVTRYYLLPHIDDWRTRIEATASAAVQAPVTMGRIEADWQGLHPRLLLRNVALQDAGGGTALALPEVEVVVSWTTLIAWQPRVQSLTVQAPELEVRRRLDRRWTIAGIVIDPQAPATDSSLADWVLAQRHISIRDARVHFVDELGALRPDGGSAKPAADSASASAAGTVAAAMEPAADPAPRAPAAGTASSSPAPTVLEFTDVNFVLTHGLTSHRMALQLRPPPQLSGAIDVRAEFTQAWDQPATHFASWSGRLYAQFDAADLARLDALTRLVPAPARIDRATGALRAWADFDGLDIQRLRADVALNDVAAQLRPDLQPLRLNVLEGRVTQASWTDRDGSTRETALTGLHLEGPEGLHLPATDLLLRTTRPAAAGAAPGNNPGAERLHMEANRIVLSDWSRLALQVPLPAEWLTLIERTAARGTLEDVDANWGGGNGTPRAYALRARFSGLGFSLGGAPPERDAGTPDKALAAPGTAMPSATSTPGSAPVAAPHAGAAASAAAPTAADAAYACENLAGSVELNQDSGSLRLDAAHSRLQLPALFDEPAFAFDSLAARVRWNRDNDGRVSIELDAFSAVNDDLDVSATGAFLKPANGTARIDLSGRLARARIKSVYRYLPHVTAAPARAWMRGALLEGDISDGSFYLHGDPAHFPFADPKAGEFHASLHVQDGQLDVAPRPQDAVLGPNDAVHGAYWPVLTGIDADVVFDRNRLTINGHRLKAYGYDLTGVTARLPQLELPDQHLLLDGQGSGPLSELLRYLVASPVNRMTGGALAAAEGNGPTRLKLALDIPLAHSVDSIVSGTVAFRNDAIVVRPEVAPFSDVTGELGFNQKGIRLAGIAAGYLGGDVRISGDTAADGTLAIQAAGTATPQGAKRQVEPALLRRVLDHTRGAFRYTAALAVHHGTLALSVDSDLVGLAADLPEPFRKAAAETRPLHIETIPLAGADPARETLRASYAGVLGVELRRVAQTDGGMRIERGAIGVGGRANMPDTGLLLLVDQPHLDVDRWQRLLGLSLNAPPAPAAAGTAAAPGSSGTTGGDNDSVDTIVVHASDMAVGGKTLNNVSLSARRDPDQSWYADIDSDQAAGAVHWVGTRGTVPGRITARLAKLVIPDTDKKQVTDLLDAPPTDFPALDIIAEQLELGNAKLGRLEVDAQNSAGTAGRSDSWNLQKLSLTNPDGKLTGTGSWQRDGAAPARKMAVKFTLNFSNGGALLSRFGLAEAIRNGNGKLEGDLSWRGSPFSINYPSLSGRLHLAADKGQFLKADAGVRGRLLGLFSLQSLAHRVTGDFRDVFAEGFAFDSLTGSATVQNGALSTDDFIMKGLNAVVRIKGEADINAETQNLEVVVIPEINASTATLAYALVNPAIGLGTFVANFLLRKPLQAAFTNVYEVTGSWADPKVEPVKTETRAAAAATPDKATP